MKIKYETISINPPPLDVDILVVKEGVFGEAAAVVKYLSSLYSVQDVVDQLTYEKFTRWAEV
jgi:hypothetical protein